MSEKYVVMIQCDIAHRRCSGFACTQSFYERQDHFKTYSPQTPYISFTCGGCCGKGISAKLEHFLKRARKDLKLKQEDIVIHLSSCMVTDNHHYDRCPHVDYIKGIVEKKGFKNLVEGTCISKNAQRKRESATYKTYGETDQ